MTDNLYSGEAVIRGVTYSVAGGHKVSLEIDPEGWEDIKAAGASVRCMMVLVPIQEDGTPDRDVTEKVKKPKTRAQYAGILCNDERFQRWMGSASAESAAAWVRTYCGITSRRELDVSPRAASTFEAMVNKYKADTGQIGAPR